MFMMLIFSSGCIFIHSPLFENDDATAKDTQIAELNATIESLNATIDELNAEIEALKKTSKAKTAQQSSGNSGNGNSGNGGSGNTQTQPQTPPPAESQQPSSDDDGAVKRPYKNMKSLGYTYTCKIFI